MWRSRSSPARQPRRSVRWCTSRRLADPTPWLSAASCCSPRSRGRHPESQAPRQPPRRPRLAASASGSGLHALSRSPTAGDRGGRRAGLPADRDPYDTPFIAVTQKASAARQEQYALLQAVDRGAGGLQRICSRSAPGPIARPRDLIGGTARGLRRRGEPQALHAFRRELPATRCRPWGRAARARARHRGPASAVDPAWRRGRWRCRSPAPRPPACRRRGWSPSRTHGLSEFDRACCTRPHGVVLELLRRTSQPRRSAGSPGTCSPRLVARPRRRHELRAG